VTLRRFPYTVVAVKKTVSITYSESMFVALGIQHKMRISYIVIFSLTDFAVLFHFIP